MFEGVRFKDLSQSGPGPFPAGSPYPDPSPQYERAGERLYRDLKPGPEDRQKAEGPGTGNQKCKEQTRQVTVATA